MIFLDKWAFCCGLNLNVELRVYGLLRLIAKDSHVSRNVGVCSVDGVSAAEHVSTLRCRARWGLQSQRFFLSGSVLDDGLCPIDLPRVFARYRSESSRAGQTALSHGAALQDRVAQHPCPRQRHT